MDENNNNQSAVYPEKPKVANLGIQLFFKALEDQGCECVQIDWIPGYERSEEIDAMLDEFL